MQANPNASLPPVYRTHIPTGSLVTVSAGRNIGTTPMIQSDWDEFQNQLKLELLTWCSEVFGPFHGTGEWEGVSEESVVFTALVHYPANPNHVQARLGKIAETFEQDAVAWSFGPGMLAGPTA